MKQNKYQLADFSKSLIKVIAVTVFGLLSVKSTVAQISIAPTQVFIHDKQGAGEIFLTNTSDVPQEISFEMTFGYPASTENGRISMVYNDSLKRDQHGLDEHVRLFPSRVVIPPRWSQTVRIQILSMADKPDGVYWTRLMVSSSPVTPDVGDRNADGITTDIEYVLEQNIPLFYRHGKNSTGIEVVDVEKIYDNSSKKLVVTPEIERTGNSPYLGTMYASLFDKSGSKLDQKEIPAYFYYLDWRRLTFEQIDASKGPFRLDLEFKTHRKSISSKDIVKADDQSYSTQILLD